MKIFVTAFIFLATFNPLRNSELILEWMLHKLSPSLDLLASRLNAHFLDYLLIGQAHLQK